MTRFVSSDVYAQNARGVSLAPPAGARPKPHATPAAGPTEHTAGQPVRLVLRLETSFAALNAQGTPIRLSQKKGQLMLAMLACSPEMKRSRDWLRRHLWHRSFTSHGFSSLRQCLHNLRGALGDQSDCLCADRDFVWLEATAVDWGGSREDPSLFLEDIVRIAGPAREWLERERARLYAGRVPG